MTSLFKQRRGLGITTVVVGGAMGVALTFGNLATSADNLFRKVGQVIHPSPSSLVVDHDGGLIVGSGTTITNALVGTCDLIGMDASQTATTTSAYDCAITGVLVNDFVFVNPATTTPTTNLGWNILGANASSTSGYITVHVQNLTGGNAVPSATAVGSSTQYFILR